MNAETAENSERLEYRHVRVGERRAVVLQRIFSPLLIDTPNVGQASNNFVKIIAQNKLTPRN